MEQATDRVGMIVRAAPAVIDRVLAAAVRVAFQQAQLAQQAGMIGQVDETARERRQSFEVELRLRQLAADIRDATGLPRAREPSESVIIAVTSLTPYSLHSSANVLVVSFGSNGGATPRATSMTKCSPSLWPMATT